MRILFCLDARHSAKIFVCAYVLLGLIYLQMEKPQKGQLQKGHKAFGIQLFLAFQLMKNTEDMAGHFDTTICQ